MYILPTRRLAMNSFAAACITTLFTLAHTTAPCSPAGSPLPAVYAPTLVRSGRFDSGTGLSTKPGGNARCDGSDKAPPGLTSASEESRPSAIVAAIQPDAPGCATSAGLLPVHCHGCAGSTPRRCVPREPVYRQCRPWELAAQDRHFPQSTIALINAVAAEYPRTDVDMAALIYALAVPESSGRQGCVYCQHFGLLQVAYSHRREMARMGLGWNEGDRLRWSCIVITAQLDKGSTLYTALRPWSTRRRALRIYGECTE